MDYSYIGSGKIRLREIGGTGGFFEVGNASGLNIKVESDEKRQTDYTQTGGGVYNKVERITAVTLEIALAEFRPKPLNFALFGAHTEVASGTVTDEAHTIEAVDTLANGGIFIPTTHLASSITTVELAPSTALTEGTDWDEVPGGILVYSDGPNTLAADDDILITYAKVATDRIEAIKNSGKEFEVVFAGLNEARSGKMTRITAFRCKAGALADWALIGDDYANTPVSLEITKDTTKVGAGESQYFFVEIEK